MNYYTKVTYNKGEYQAFSGSLELPTLYFQIPTALESELLDHKHGKRRKNPPKLSHSVRLKRPLEMVEVDKCHHQFYL